MEDLKDEGKLKSIGVSNFRPQDFEKLLKVCRHKPVINQLEFHPLVLKHLEPVLAIHKEHNIVTESVSIQSKSNEGAVVRLLQLILTSSF